MGGSVDDAVAQLPVRKAAQPQLGGRLGERMEIAVGTLDPKLDERDVTEWETNRSDVEK